MFLVGKFRFVSALQWQCLESHCRLGVAGEELGNPNEYLEAQNKYNGIIWH